MFKSVKPYIKFFESKSVRQFANRDAVKEYLESDVFSQQEFINHVSETATSTRVSYLLAYELITNYLIDILYEIDQTVSIRKKKRKISVYSYFFLEIGFMVSLRDKKMFLEKFIKL